MALKLISNPNKLHGTRYLAFKSQVIISSGIVTLDSVLGGGIPIGSLLLIEEDENNIFSDILFKYYYAEGIACGHKIFVGAMEKKTRNIVYRVPNVVDPISTNERVENDIEMKIAWRYQDAPQVKSAPGRGSTLANLGHHFDLSKNVSNDIINSSDITYWPTLEENSYRDLLVQISKAVDETKDKVVRIGVHSVGTALWNNSQDQITNFLYTLRAIVHRSSAVAFISLPTDLITNPRVVGRCENLCDTVIKLESLLNSSNPLYGDYKGLIKFTKFPTVNTISPHVPEGQDWGFKLTRKKFNIEKLHLPPELEESTQREQDESVSISCQSTNKSIIDF